MWLINELKRELCPQAPFSEIVSMAEKSNSDALIDADSPEFLAPASMRTAFDNATAHALTGICDYFRCAVRSLAMSYRKAIEEVENNTGRTYEKLYIVGGGAKNKMLNELTAELTGKQVIALPIEATSLGNLKIQMEVTLQ